MQPIKRMDFDTFWGEGWPTAEQLKPYFLERTRMLWRISGGGDTASLVLEGVDGTGGRDLTEGRRDISLYFTGHPKYGVCLMHHRTSTWTYSSKGDLTKLRTFVRTRQGDLMPLGLFIPFEKAWQATKDFIENDGQRSTAIDWVDNRTFDEDTFPVPHAVLKPGDTVVK